MNQDGSANRDLDFGFLEMDSLLSTPCNINYDQRVPSFDDVSIQDYTDCLEDMLQILQDCGPTCQQTPTYNQETTTSLYDELFLSSTSKKCQTPQLETSKLNECVLQELDVISTELFFYSNNRKGEKVKRRLFSFSNDEEPTPKKQRIASFDETDSDSEFMWTFSGRRS